MHDATLANKNTGTPHCRVIQALWARHFFLRRFVTGVTLCKVWTRGFVWKVSMPNLLPNEDRQCLVLLLSSSPLFSNHHANRCFFLNLNVPSFLWPMFPRGMIVVGTVRCTTRTQLWTFQEYPELWWDTLNGLAPFSAIVTPKMITFLIWIPINLHLPRKTGKGVDNPRDTVDDWNPSSAHYKGPWSKEPDFSHQ